jgi:regulator of replication initiation timing
MMKVSIIYREILASIFQITFLGNIEDSSFLRGRITELTRQLDLANRELRNMQIEIGHVTAHNDILKKENEELRASRKGRRRNRESDDNVEQVLTKRMRIGRVRHSSDDEEEAVNEEARVRQIYFLSILIKLTIILTDF